MPWCKGSANDKNHCAWCKCRSCSFCITPPPPPSLPPPPEPPSSPPPTPCLNGKLSADGTVCCTGGCGQSREQCGDTHDVCQAKGRADTTRANCCPSAIRSTGKYCSPSQ